MEITLNPIGIIHSCYKEKFGIPRQPGLVKQAPAKLEILPPFDSGKEAFRGLDQFSHIWVIFVFHGIKKEKWKPTVRPQRLGGNKKQGVFATRSGFRPNPIGLSAVKLEKIAKEKNRLFLYLKGGDFLDKTPVLDIKPYLPYSDRLDAEAGIFSRKPNAGNLRVKFSDQAMQFCKKRENEDIPGLRKIITEILENDPRPAYYLHHPGKNNFGMRIFDFDVKFIFCGDNTIEVLLLA